MQFEKDKIIEQLLSNEMVITFNKVNGDERVMTCTLKPELLPAQKVTENKKEPSAKQLENRFCNEVQCFSQLSRGDKTCCKIREHLPKTKLQ